MSISDNYAPDRSLGNGATTQFSGTWKVLNATYFKAALESVATGVLTPLNQGSDYTLDFDDDGYEIDLAVAPTSAYYVVRYREVDLTQTDPYRTSKGFQGKVIEDSFDKLTAIDQDQQDQIDRSLKFQVGSPFAGYMIDNPLDGYGLIWDVPNQRLRNTTAPLADLEGDAEIVADNIVSVVIVATNIAAVNIVSANIGSVNTVAGIAASVVTVAGIAANITAVAGNSANINAVAANSANINLVAGSIANVNAVGASIANVNTVSGSIANVNTVAGSITSVNTVAANMATITAAANNIPKANRTAIVNPTVAADAAAGYSEGSLWINTVTNTGFLCLDPANGAAIWNQITTAATSAASITYSNATSGLTATNVQTAIDELAARPIFDSGDTLYSYATAKTGWVLGSGRSIGNAASGATERANADTLSLFVVLYNNITATPLILQDSAGSTVGRGANAAADFAANRRLILPDERGRASYGKDNMGGTSANRLTGLSGGVDGDFMGNVGGAEAVTLATGDLPSHTHNVGTIATTSGGAHTHGLNSQGSPYTGTGALAERTTTGPNGLTTLSDGAHTHVMTGATATQGSGTAHNNVPPAIIKNLFIKL